MPLVRGSCRLLVAAEGDDCVEDDSAAFAAAVLRCFSSPRRSITA